MANVFQVITRAEQHTGDVIPTQEQREAVVATRIADRKDEKLILEGKLMTGKTSTPV